MFYSPQSGIFSFGTVSTFALMVLVSTVVHFQFENVFLAKFQTVDDTSIIYSLLPKGGEDSVYLTNLRINTRW